MATHETEHGKTFAKNSVIMLTRRVVDILIGFVTIFFIARILGKEGQGEYSLIILLPTMLDAFFNLGISPATVYYTAKKKKEISEIIRINVMLAGILSLAGIIAGGAVLLLLSDEFFKGIPLYLLVLVLSGLPAKMGFSFLVNVFLGIQDYKTYNLVMIVNRLLFLGILLLLYIFNPDVQSNVIAFISADFVSIAALFILLVRRFHPYRETSITSENVLRLVKYGIKSHLNNVLNFLNYRIDMFLVSFFLGSGAVGLYSVAVSIAERIWMFSSSIASVLFSTVSGLDDASVRVKLSSTVCRNVFFISLVVSGILFAGSGLIVTYILGNDFRGTEILLRLLLPGIAAGSISKVLCNYVAAIGKPEINLYIGLLSVSSSVVMDLLFLPRYGVMIAPLVSTVSYVLSAIIITVYYKRRTGNSYRTILLIGRMDIAKYISLVRRIMRLKAREA